MLLPFFLSLLAACSTPSLRPLYTPQTVVRDDGLIGTWESEGKMRTRAVVATTEGPAYRVTLDVWYDGEHKTTLLADLRLVRLGEETFADLELERKTRERIVQTYGALLLPVHQIFRFKRDDDTLKVQGLDDDQLGKSLRRGAVSLAHETRPTEDGEMLVLTAATDELQRFFRENTGHAELFEDVATFSRTTDADS